PPDEVFPLLCPVREVDWVPGWDPREVISQSGIAEPQCVFFTGPADNESIWIVTDYAPPTSLDFIKVTPGETVGRISIRLRGAGAGETHAEVRYEYTSLGERGTSVVDAFTAEHYDRFMRDWETALNHYLRTGTKLEPPS